MECGYGLCLFSWVSRSPWALVLFVQPARCSLLLSLPRCRTLGRLQTDCPRAFPAVLSVCLALECVMLRRVAALALRPRAGQLPSITGPVSPLLRSCQLQVARALTTASPSRPPRVAIVGGGPSGFYVAHFLLKVCIVSCAPPILIILGLHPPVCRHTYHYGVGGTKDHGCDYIVVSFNPGAWVLPALNRHTPKLGLIYLKNIPFRMALFAMASPPTILRCASRPD